MTPLLSLLGQDVATPEARQVLSRYPGLQPDVQDLGPDVGLESVHYLRSEDDGLLIKCSPEGEVRAIFLMSEGKDGFEQFDGELPGKLTFESTPQDAIRALGPPVVRRPPSRLGSLTVGEFLRFDWPEHSVNIQFRSGEPGIELVTVMTAKSVPGRSHAQPE